MLISEIEDEYVRDYYGALEDGQDEDAESLLHEGGMEAKEPVIPV